MMRNPFILVLALFVPLAAMADTVGYSVDYVVEQRGNFMEDSCKKLTKEQMVAKSESDSKQYDFCSCQSDIVYPQVSNMPNQLHQQQINFELQHNFAPTMCNAEILYQPASGKVGSKYQLSFTVTYMGTNYVSFLQRNIVSPAGAGKPAWGFIGSTFRLSDGKKLAITDMLFEGKLAEVNSEINTQLKAQGVASQYLGKPYLTPTGCTGCAAYLSRDGLKVIFDIPGTQAYVGSNPTAILNMSYLKPEMNETL